MDCEHNERFKGVVFLPNRAGGCLACHAEQLEEEIADLKSSLEVLEFHTNDYRKTLATFKEYDGEVGLWSELIRQRDEVKAINAELLALLESVLKSGSNIDRSAIKAAIANAQPTADLGGD